MYPYMVHKKSSKKTPMTYMFNALRTLRKTLRSLRLNFTALKQNLYALKFLIWFTKNLQKTPMTYMFNF